MSKTPRNPRDDSGPEPALLECDEFAGFVHQFLRDHIALADQKAAFVFAAAAAILAYIYENGATAHLRQPSNLWSLRDWAGAIALVLLTVASLLAVATVAPRGGVRLRSGVIYWQEICSHKSPTFYANTVASLSSRGIQETILQHCFVIAGICDRKYKVLGLSLALGTLGFISASLFVFLVEP